MKTLLFSATLLATTLVADAQAQELKPRLVEMTDIGQADTVRRLSLLFAGDLMQHDRQLEAARCKDGGYDYTGCFAAIQPEIERADVALANLEVTMGGKPYQGYPCFSAPDEFLYAIRDAGFDILFTGNNHCLDKGKGGVERTIAMLDSLGVGHVGTYINKEERDRQYPFLIEKNGLRIALLQFTYGTNGTRIPAPVCVNKIDTLEILNDLNKAKSMQPDLIIAAPHWGVEYEIIPRKEEAALAQWHFDNGVDGVVGTHPHVVRPVEMRVDSLTGQQHLVAYSLGNLISDQSGFIKYGGMMLRLEIEKESRQQKARIAQCGYMLTFVSRPPWSHKKQYRVLPVDVDPSEINTYEKKKLNDYLERSRNLFSTHNVGIEEYFMERGSR